eukprot:5685770-Karenia_brevis.AAC.1
MPQMVDSFSVHGERRAGFLPPLLPLLGAGSFDDAPESRWLSHMVGSRARLGTEFKSTWELLQREVVEPTPGTALSHSAGCAGRHTYRVQASLTRARERHVFNQLDAQIRVLPHDDARRLAWMNLDHYSTAWVGSWPSSDSWMTDA